MARRTLARTHSRRGLYLHRDPNEGGGGGTGGTDTGSTGGTDGGQPGGQPGGADSGKPTDSGKTFSKDDVERIVTERLARDRAAEERRQQQANATERQRIEALERDLAEERLGRIRTRVAVKHGIADLEDVLKGATEEELDASAKRIADRVGKGGGGNGGGGGKGGRTRQTRTVTEGGGAALTAKERAAVALRGLRGGTSADD